LQSQRFRQPQVVLHEAASLFDVAPNDRVSDLAMLIGQVARGGGHAHIDPTISLSLDEELLTNVQQPLAVASTHKRVVKLRVRVGPALSQFARMGRMVNWPPKNGRHEVCYVDLVEYL